MFHSLVNRDTQIGVCHLFFMQEIFWLSFCARSPVLRVAAEQCPIAARLRGKLPLRRERLGFTSLLRLEATRRFPTLTLQRKIRRLLLTHWSLQHILWGQLQVCRYAFILRQSYHSGIRSILKLLKNEDLCFSTFAEKR